MCGITGFWQLNHRKLKSPLDLIARDMAARLKHRGPNATGVWCDEAANIAFGFQRLSIIDLSAAGNQPMISPSGRWVMVYNGEVYNAHELRQELMHLGMTFQGRSDTEVVLAACETWGVARALQRCVGMFALAVWDTQQHKLFLARDRLGIKPLYWGIHRGILFFASELKSFFAHPEWQPQIDRSALVSYFRFNYIQSEHTIYQDIHKLKPGCMVEINDKGQITPSIYWDMNAIVMQPITTASEEEIIVQFDTLLRDAVKRRMISDVPLGAFLSGGIDSSLVVALMQAESSQPVKSFTIGFHESEYDEAPYAKAIAHHLGTEHHELYLHAKDAMDVIPNLAHWYDEPFADASQIPTYLVSKLAAQQVTVSLSGDGGDELFAGYDRYHLPSLWVQCGHLPLPMRRLLARGIKTLTPYQWNALSRCIPANKRPKNMGIKAHKWANVLADPAASFYKRLMSFWGNPAELVVNGQENPTWCEASTALNPLAAMQWCDTITYLPDDILTKVDRASMAASLEARVPLLDHRVVEFAWSLPQTMKVREGQRKWLLRKLLQRYVPDTFIQRPKMGFGMPIGQWLRGPLRDWAEDLLAEKRLQSEGILHATPIRKRWKQHLSGRYEWQYSLWGVLMFQTWYQTWFKERKNV